MSLPIEQIYKGTAFPSDLSITSWRMCCATFSAPSPVLQFTKTNGFVPLTALQSLSTTERSTPTYGARSILFITSKSHVSIPNPLFLGYFSPDATAIIKMK